MAFAYTAIKYEAVIDLLGFSSERLKTMETQLPIIEKISEW